MTNDDFVALNARYDEVQIARREAFRYRGDLSPSQNLAFERFDLKQAQLSNKYQTQILAELDRRFPEQGNVSSPWWKFWR